MFLLQVLTLQRNEKTENDIKSRTSFLSLSRWQKHVIPEVNPRRDASRLPHRETRGEEGGDVEEQ